MTLTTSIATSTAQPRLEFLGAWVQRTVEHDLPREIDYLKRHDAALQRIMNMLEMPVRLAQSLVMFIRKNNN